MNKESTATEANATAIAPQEGTQVTVPTQDDSEAKFLALEKEKENYKNAYLKERKKNKGEIVDNDETEDDKIRRITEETIASSRLAQIAQEQDEIIKKALKENKELKLAQANRNSTPTALGTHSEGQPVTDTSVTPEQLAFFKSKGWNDKDIEAYKKNARKTGAIR